MALGFVGTAQALALGTAANPDPVDVTVAAGASHGVFSWTFDGYNSGNHVLTSVTLNGEAPDVLVQVGTGDSYEVCAGYAIWWNPPSGTQELDVLWDIAPLEGPTAFFDCIEGAAQALVDADIARGVSSAAVSVTLTGLTAGDIVLKHDQRYDTGGSVPGLSTDWTNRQTQSGVQSENARLSYIIATDTDEVCACVSPEYSSVVALAFTEASAPSGPTIDTHPANQSKLVGETATFTVAATTSGGTLSYQWQRDSGSGFTNVGTNSTSYTTGTLVIGDDGDLVRCVVTDDNGSTNSNNATLTVTAATTPDITSTSSATPAHGSALTITGTDFGATQGSGSVTIGGIAQTVTSWADTSITVTVGRSTNKYGVALNVVVTDNAAAASDPFALTSITPPSGWAYVNVGTPNTTAANRITASPDIASGDQIAYETVGGTVEVFSDATFSVSGSTTEFDVEVWTDPDGWGSVATQSTVTAVGSNADGAYAVRAAVGATGSGTYLLAAAVGADGAGAYSVLAAVGAEGSASYLVRQAAGADALGSYIVQAAVGADATGTYGLAGAVGSNAGGSYSVRAAVGQDASGQYIVLQAAGAEQSGQYLVRQAVGAIAFGQYGVDGVLPDGPAYPHAGHLMVTVGALTSTP